MSGGKRIFNLPIPSTSCSGLFQDLSVLTARLQTVGNFQDKMRRCVRTHAPTGELPCRRPMSRSLYRQFPNRDNLLATRFTERRSGSIAGLTLRVRTSRPSSSPDIVPWNTTRRGADAGRVRSDRGRKWRARRISARKNRMPKHRMTGMKKGVPNSVDEYIAAQPEAVRPKLEQVRAAIRRAVPEALEGIGTVCPDISCTESRCCISPASRNTIRCLPRRGRSSRRSKMSSGAMTCERDCPFPTHQTGSGEAHQPDRKAACGWDRRHGEKTGAGPRERNAQLGTVGGRAASQRQAFARKAVIRQNAV